MIDDWDPFAGLPDSIATPLRQARQSERDMINNHAPDCYAPKGECISCGCNRHGLYDYQAGPCVSHRYLVRAA